MTGGDRGDGGGKRGPGSWAARGVQYNLPQSNGQRYVVRAGPAIFRRKVLLFNYSMVYGLAGGLAPPRAFEGLRDSDQEDSNSPVVLMGTQYWTGLTKKLRT